jgi:sorbitol/mannitol transport system permease protein
MDWHISPLKRSNFTLLWLISTRMLPPVGIIVPLFVIARDLGIRDTVLGMVIVYTSMNLPLVVWMMRSFFLDVPYEILEAGRIDGTNLWQEFRFIAIPLVVPGLVATFLLCMIFAWNEFFFAFNLTVTQASPLSVYISSFKTAEGLFWAKMLCRCHSCRSACRCSGVVHPTPTCARTAQWER